MPPPQFGPFRVLHQIGVGALGPVFRTYEPQRDRLVAVKVFRLDITPEQARALADELSRGADVGLFHPSIVEPIAAGVEGTVAYHAEEYVAAESLDVAMRHYAPAPVATVLPYITQLAGAIDFARTVGVGHGALHPRDIFITPEEARAAGFGVVGALERVGLRAPVRRPYSPPERIAGSRWSTEADVFSLAVITYELLTGRRPAGIGLEIGALPPGAEPLHAVLARAMDEDPAARFPTALGFAAALEAAAHGRMDEYAAGAAASGSGRASELPLSPPAAVPPVAALARGSGAGEADVHDEAMDEDEGEDDIAPERDEDEAHHRLLLQESEQTELEAEREDGAPLEEDIEAEAEADRYAGDDFLLDAAGVASAPDLDAADLRRRPEPLDERALDDEEAMVGQPPPPLFGPEDLRRPDSEPLPARMPSHAAPRDPVQSAFGRTAPALGQSAAAADDAPPRRSRAALAAVLVLGVLAGLGAGYVLWGRTTPGGQAWSEGTVGPADSQPPRTPDPARAEAPPPAPVPADERPAPPAAPARESEPLAQPKPVATSGTLVVRSQPTGAGVTVNGRWRGRTPLTLDDLPFARYQVRVVQPGYGPGTEVVTLSASAPARSLSMRLRPEGRAAAPARTPSADSAAGGRAAPTRRPAFYTGSIYVDSRPRGARVFIDGRAVGATPLSVPDVPIGSHVVRLELPDHRIWSTTARVAAGQTSRVTGSLERIQ